MLQISIVVFREILEISLIIGILSAATKEIKGSGLLITFGLVAGIFSSILLAFFTDRISESLNGFGQEFFNGMILLSAATMMGSTVVWMQHQAKHISGKMKKLGNSIASGSKSRFILPAVAFLSVLREGSEIALFVYSNYLSGVDKFELIAALAIGIALGTAIGIALYFGILKTFGRKFLAATTWLLSFLAAGIAAAGVGFLVNAEALPAIKDPLFDLSYILPQQSLAGTVLNSLFGYIDRPSAMQVIVYCLTILLLYLALRKRSVTHIGKK